MLTGQAIVPNRKARKLFNRMVALSDDNQHLGLTEALVIGVEHARAGDDPSCSEEISQLTTEQWICAAPDGGWRIN